jgi:hypothetical protein
MIIATEQMIDELLGRENQTHEEPITLSKTILTYVKKGILTFLIVMW